MQIKTLLKDEDAVSPVIGVILMVAITVILAAVIGTFVLGLGDQVQSSAPNSNFQFNYSDGGDGWGDTDDDQFGITHNGGQDVEASNMQILVGSQNVESDLTVAPGTGNNLTQAWPSTVSTGDQIVVTDANGNGLEIDSGETVRVVWESGSGGSSNTIGQSEIPS